MHLLRRDKAVAAGTPVVPRLPPRPASREVSPTVSKASSTDSLEQGGAPDSAKSPGVFKGVMQKVNPFKSASQTSSTASKAPSSDSLEQGNLPESSQSPGVFKGVMQKVNPFKSASQTSSTASKAPSSESLEQGNLPESSQVSMHLLHRDKAVAAGTPVVPRLPPRPASREELDNPITHSLDRGDGQDNSDIKSELLPKSKRTGVMGVMQKVNPFKSTSQVSPTVSKASSTDSLEQGGAPDSAKSPGVFKGVMQKVNPFKSASQTSSTVSKAPSSESLERGNLPESSQMPKEEAQTDNEKQHDGKQNPGVFKGMMQKVNPFKSSAQTQDSLSQHSGLSSSTGSLASENNNITEKKVKQGETVSDTVDHPGTKQSQGVFKGMMQKVNPFKSSAQTPDTQSIHSDLSSSSSSLDDSTIERHSIWYTDVAPGSEGDSRPKEAQKKRTGTLRIRRIFPTGALFGFGKEASATGSPDTQPLSQEEVVEVQTLEMAEVPVPSEGASLNPLDDEDGLLDWWRTVEGWEEWSEAAQENEAVEVVEDAADRVFMAARLFVRLFNQRGASLQQRVLELLALADAADIFHKKTVKASIGGGVASVAGSITTITGLILAPFTMGTSLIVTAVGIAVATAGGVASASANITDTVHSKTGRKKVEKIIQDYQDEMKDIKECLDFVQEGMETLEEWDFEAYVDSISKKHLNQNVKHVLKEGGRAGKALLINTESLISTVQVLSVAGGAAKAAQVMSVTTGVMSGLFLALDVFFLAKDSLELKKGAKTEFATKIREVCKDLQDGLLELNRVKEELQKTMDGIEVEVEEEDEEEEDVLASDPKKLAQLEE